MAVAMQHGHNPREVRAYSWRDLELLLTLAAGQSDLTDVFRGP